MAGIHPRKDALSCGRRIEFFHHDALPEWGGAAQQDSFALLHPESRKRQHGLYVVLHSAGHDLFSCIGCTFQKNNHDIYRTPGDFFGLYLDCRAHAEQDFWWGGINAHGEGAPDRKNTIQPVEKRLIATIEWVISQYPIDSARVYICGNSMGGSGALGLAMCRGDLFAAVKVNVPAGVEHCADRFFRRIDAGARLPDPPVCIDYSAQNDLWSDGHELLFREMHDKHFALYGYWGAFGHADNDSDMLKENDLIHTFDWLAVRKDRAYPVFTDTASDDPVPWPDGRASKEPGQVNAFCRWENVMDRKGCFKIALFLLTAADVTTRFSIPEETLTTVSLRRLQHFLVQPRERVCWRFGISGLEPLTFTMST